MVSLESMPTPSQRAKDASEGSAVPIIVVVAPTVGTAETRSTSIGRISFILDVLGFELVSDAKKIVHVQSRECCRWGSLLDTAVVTCVALRKPNDSVGGSGHGTCWRTKKPNGDKDSFGRLPLRCMHFSGSTVQVKIYAAVMNLTTHGDSRQYSTQSTYSTYHYEDTTTNKKT